MQKEIFKSHLIYKKAFFLNQQLPQKCFIITWSLDPNTGKHSNKEKAISVFIYLFYNNKTLRNGPKVLGEKVSVSKRHKTDQTLILKAFFFVPTPKRLVLTLFRVQSCLTVVRYPGSGTTTPASPWMGSTMKAATLGSWRAFWAQPSAHSQ